MERGSEFVSEFASEREGEARRGEARRGEVRDGGRADE